MLSRKLLPWTIVASVFLHGVAYASLGPARAKRSVEPRSSEVRFEVVSKPERLTPEPERPPEPPPPEPPKPERAAVAAAKPEPEPGPVLEPPPPVAEGVTLSSDGSGSSFAMPLGNGGSLPPTPVQKLPKAVLSPPVSSAATARTPSEPALVAVGNLSARPSPPALGSALEKNYPADARRRGLGGTAKVRARIDPDGVVRRVTLVEESAAGFGAACSRTLNGSRWTPPKDHGGRSVATEIRYTCRFVVQP